MNQLESKLVRDIVKEVPKTADVFRKKGIDFCCGGEIPLLEAAEEAKYDTQEIIDLVKETYDDNASDGGSLDVQYLSIPSLIDYIQNKYHKGLDEELKALSPYVTKVSKVHGDRHPHLIELKELFDRFKENMIEHTKDEDERVFPNIVKYVYDTDAVDEETLNGMLQDLIDDHDGSGDVLKRMREITNGYELPVDACGTYTLVYARLEQLEKETFDHVHLENHILFERVRDFK